MMDNVTHDPRVNDAPEAAKFHDPKRILMFGVSIGYAIGATLAFFAGPPTVAALALSIATPAVILVLFSPLRSRGVSP